MKRLQEGYLQLELLVVILVLGLGAGALLQNPLGWFNFYYKTQLQTAAQLLASDLRHLQAQVMFHHVTSQYFLEPTRNKAGYTISYDIPAVILLERSFARGYCPEVYLKNSLTLSFASSGSPSATGTLILGHRKLENYTLRVELQPITGRVLIYEN